MRASNDRETSEIRQIWIHERGVGSVMGGVSPAGPLNDAANHAMRVRFHTAITLD